MTTTSGSSDSGSMPFQEGSWQVIETKPDVPDWKQTKKRNIAETAAKEYAQSLNTGPSGQAGYVYEAEPMPNNTESTD